MSHLRDKEVDVRSRRLIYTHAWIGKVVEEIRDFVEVGCGRLGGDHQSRGWGF
jgi:hypothetical protein